MAIPRPTRPQVVAAIWGATIMLVFVLMLLVGYAGVVVWVRAYHGEIAYETLVQMQQQTVQKPAPAPTK